jgi:hypothetical protein
MNNINMTKINIYYHGGREGEGEGEGEGRENPRVVVHTNEEKEKECQTDDVIPDFVKYGRTLGCQTKPFNEIIRCPSCRKYVKPRCLRPETQALLACLT